MSIRSTLLAATFTLSGLGAAQADTIEPIQAQTIELGDVSGSAYYTVEENGFRVVTTLAQGELGTPVRFVTVLSPGQKVVLSTPRGAQSEPLEVEISREADAVHVRKAALSY